MKKITLRTKITLTIAGLLALTGIFYAANPTTFSTGVTNSVGIAAAPGTFVVTEYSTQNINKLDCFGTLSFLAAIPNPPMGGAEKYVAFAPTMSANAGFTVRDLFVTQGTEVYKVAGGSGTLFATIPGCAEDHTGITFDHEGTFGYEMIVTCQNGGVWRVDGNGSPILIADTGTFLEGPAVVPQSFGPYGGQILVADEVNGQVHAISNARLRYSWCLRLGRC